MNDGTLSDDTAGPPQRWPWPARVAAIALVIGLLAALAGVAALLRRPAVPAEDSAAVGYTRDMSAHHAQAVEMADIVLDRAQDPVVRHIAKEILYQQQGEFGQMQGWLDVWGHPQNSARPAMGWMGHPVEGRMPGMASPEELAALAAADGAEAEQLFLELMITHHEAGGEMMEAILERTRQPQVVALTERMLAVQTTEIADMQALLDEPGPPVPAGDHAGH